jgi:predicted GNAT family N-acyltransferase
VQTWELRYIETCTPEYAEAKELRFDALYGELGLPRELVEDTDGWTYEHLVALVDGHIVGYARLHLDGGASRIFQVTVALDWRRRGVASSLMNELIDLARSHGRTQVELDARAHVVGMYEGLGFVVDGQEFLSPRTNTPHFPMKLTLF